MGNKINIAKLLKDCPKGMELDCSMFDNVTFVRVDNSRKQFPIEIEVGGLHSKYLTKEGCFHDTTLLPEAKCVIFPKGKTTWEGFVPPCKFKVGDIISMENACGCHTFIYNNITDEYVSYGYYAIITSMGNFKVNNFCSGSKYRFATEEGKEKLFQAIKNNGYKWNVETKTLEKLIIPKFHEGDWVTDGISKCQIRFIDDTHYWYSENCILGSIESIDKQYHLWTIKDAKDGDVLCDYIEGYNNPLIFILKKFEHVNFGLAKLSDYSSYCFLTVGDKQSFKEGRYHHKHNIKPATKEQRDLLFHKMIESGYKWNSKTKTLEKLVVPKFKVGDRIKDKNNRIWFVVQVSDKHFDISSVPNAEGYFVPINDQDDYELVPNKFDITILKPFDKVLVRDKSNEVWTANFYSHYDATSDKPFICVGWSEMNEYRYCIPYEANKELLGTTNECEDYYKTW